MISASAFGLILLGLAASAAIAAGSYEFDEGLSLRGDCGAGAPDNVADPGCPGGTHPGRFEEPRSVAIDAYGNEYVASYAENGTLGRIDVFDDEGNFVTQLLDPRGPMSVGVDSEGNLYVFEKIVGGEAEIAVYPPTEYDGEAGNIEYDASLREVVTTSDIGPLGGLTVDLTNDHLYVTYVGGSPEEYDSAKEGNGLLHTVVNPKFNWSNWIAVDGERRRLYVSYCANGIAECGVLVLSADFPYTELADLDGSNTPAGKFLSLKGSTSIAADESNGHFFVADLEASDNIYEFDQNFDYFATTTFASFEAPNTIQIAVSNSRLDLAATNHRYLFVPYPKVAGALFAFQPPNASAPDVESVSVTHVAEGEAELHATVNPNGATTSYVFEYVTQQEFDEGEFAAAHTAGAGTLPIGSSPTQVVSSIAGLSPGTSYRFRVSASNAKGSDELEASFRTFADAPITGDCPNQLLRTGFSFFLPDCRAYELVTPANTNGRPPKGVGLAGDRFATVEASPSGNTVAFVTGGGSLPGTEGTGGFNGDLYRSARGASGWAIVRMGPSGTETNNPSPGSTSPDQEYAFFWAGGEGSAVVDGVTTHYIRYPDGRAELIGRGTLGTDPGAVGKLITEGGGHIVFQTGIAPLQLEAEAAPSGTQAIYDRTPEEVTHVVSLLPGNVPAGEHDDALYLDASPDGAGIAFAIDNVLYLRLDNAATYEIGEDVTLADVSEGGRRVFYEEGGDLFAFDIELGEAIRFTETGDAQVVNVAPDG
ncbi:MAG TPA: hypothetical protein VN732_00160, partial [Solirubrobacterales bacterium]|nr:hypothetical protein [Solirubrobacterales bacterium]